MIKSWFTVVSLLVTYLWVVHGYPQAQFGATYSQQAEPDARLVARLVQELDYQLVGEMQDNGYCLQSVSMVEPSNSHPSYQAAFIFNQQPSCTAWFTSVSANASDFVRQVQAASQNGYIPTQLVATADPLMIGQTELKLASFAEYARGVRVQVRHIERTSTGEVRRLLRAGYQLLKLFGFVDNGGAAGHIGVFVTPRLSLQQRRGHHGLSLTQCIALNARMAQAGFTPVQFQVFAINAEARCAAIWEDALPRTRHRIQTGANLTNMAEEMLPTGMHLIQVSSYVDSSGAVNYVILWSSQPPVRYPGLWEVVPAPRAYLAGSEEGFLPADLAKLDSRIRDFMKKQSIMSFSYAISKDEKLKIAAAYGYSDPRSQTPLNPHNRFRIASISKPITATAIYRLVELGRLSLDQQIFGPGAIFGTRYGTLPYKERLKDIKLIHLLQHTEGGWSGHEDDGFMDPMFSLDHLNADQLIAYVLDNYPLNFTAGTHYRYCNFGYFLLAQIIEEVTGMGYEDYVRLVILSPLTMSETQVGRSGLAGRLPNEIVYTDNDGSINEFNAELNKGDGGWVSTSIDVLKFMGGVNGLPLRRELLRESTLKQMINASTASNFEYASGWMVLRQSPLLGYGHNGGLPGLATWMWHQTNGDGIEYSILISGVSTRTAYEEALFGLIAAAETDITQWPTHDLFRTN